MGPVRQGRAQDCPRGLGLTPARHGEADAECGVDPIASGLAARHHHYVANGILIVDDSAQFCALAAELLTGQGFEVLGLAADGAQALAAVDRLCPEGILLDVNLPGPDGFAVAASLAAACPRTPIVLTSAGVAHVPAGVLAACAAAAFVPKQELVTADFRSLFRPAGT